MTSSSERERQQERATRVKAMLSAAANSDLTMRCNGCRPSLHLRAAVSVFPFFDREWFPVRRWLRTAYAVFDARDARVDRPALTGHLPKSFHIAPPSCHCAAERTPRL